MSKRQVLECDGCGHRVEGIVNVPDGWVGDAGLNVGLQKIVWDHLCGGCVSGLHASLDKLWRERRASVQQVAADLPLPQRPDGPLPAATSVDEALQRRGRG